MIRDINFRSIKPSWLACISVLCDDLAKAFDTQKAVAHGILNGIEILLNDFFEMLAMHYGL